MIILEHGVMTRQSGHLHAVCRQISTGACAYANVYVKLAYVLGMYVGRTGGDMGRTYTHTHIYMRIYTTYD